MDVYGFFLFIKVLGSAEVRYTGIFSFFQVEVDFLGEVVLGLWGSEEMGSVCSIQIFGLCVVRVVCNYADIFFHSEDAFGTNGHKFALSLRLLPFDLHQALQIFIFFFLLLDHCLESLPVLV